MLGRRAYRIKQLSPWLIAGGGVVVMVLLFAVATVGLPLARPDDAAGRSGFSPAWPFGPGDGRSPAEGGDALPGPASVAASIPVTAGPASSSASARRTPPATGPTPAPTRSRSADPAPDRPEVTGRYRVMASYPGSFIGEVLVVNDGAVARQWTVELRFADNVTGLRGVLGGGGAAARPEPFRRLVRLHRRRPGRGRLSGAAALPLRPVRPGRYAD